MFFFYAYWSMPPHLRQHFFSPEDLKQKWLEENEIAMNFISHFREIWGENQ